MGKESAMALNLSHTNPSSLITSDIGQGVNVSLLLDLLGGRLREREKRIIANDRERDGERDSKYMAF